MGIKKTWLTANGKFRQFCYLIINCVKLQRAKSTGIRVEDRKQFSLPEKIA